MLPKLIIVIPCYNEQEVLPITSKMFLNKINSLVSAGKISDESRIMFVNDGSKDDTWNIICSLAKSDKHFIGISQSRNRGHQNAVLAGLMEAKDNCDITISIDCDGQDDMRLYMVFAQNGILIHFLKDLPRRAFISCFRKWAQRLFLITPIIGL